MLAVGERQLLVCAGAVHTVVITSIGCVGEAPLRQTCPVHAKTSLQISRRCVMTASKSVTNCCCSATPQEIATDNATLAQSPQLQTELEVGHKRVCARSQAAQEAVAALAQQQFQDPIRTDNMVVYPSLQSGPRPMLTSGSHEPERGAQQVPVCVRGRAAGDEAGPAQTARAPVAAAHMPRSVRACRVDALTHAADEVLLGYQAPSAAPTSSTAAPPASAQPAPVQPASAASVLGGAAANAAPGAVATAASAAAKPTFLESKQRLAALDIADVLAAILPGPAVAPIPTPAAIALKKRKKGADKAAAASDAQKAPEPKPAEPAARTRKQVWRGPACHF